MNEAIWPLKRMQHFSSGPDFRISPAVL